MKPLKMHVCSDELKIAVRVNLYETASAMRACCTKAHKNRYPNFKETLEKKRSEFGRENICLCARSFNGEGTGGWLFSDIYVHLENGVADAIDSIVHELYHGVSSICDYAGETKRFAFDEDDEEFEDLAEEACCHLIGGLAGIIIQMIAQNGISFSENGPDYTPVLFPDFLWK
jgi:hypothetical protein